VEEDRLPQPDVTEEVLAVGEVEAGDARVRLEQRRVAPVPERPPKALVPDQLIRARAPVHLGGEHALGPRRGRAAPQPAVGGGGGIGEDAIQQSIGDGSSVRERGAPARQGIHLVRGSGGRAEGQTNGEHEEGGAHAVLSVRVNPLRPAASPPPAPVTDPSPRAPPRAPR
jgi:hypothetical protein